MSSTLLSPAVVASPWPHRWAWALCCATFALVWWGGWVVASGAGMAFRDWLTSDGHAMPLYPWLTSVGDKFIEHGHRLLGQAAGLLAIALVVSCHKAPATPAVKRFSWILLAGVIVQGALGGLRVVLDERVVALVHGAVGPAFFAATAAMVLVTSRSWERLQTVATPTVDDRRLKRLAVLCAGLAYAHLLLGVVVRYSALMTSDAAGRLFETAAYLHVIVAAAVVAHLVMLAARSRRVAELRRVGIGLAALVTVQFMLGIATWLVKYGWPAWASRMFGEHDYVNREADALRALIVTGHGAAGALTVALAVVAAMIASRRVALGHVAAVGAATYAGRALA